MKFKLRGGVMIIGSLFWDLHVDRDKEDGNREEWRTSHLEMESVKNVKAPIKHGRFSKDGAYTMVFDHTLAVEKYGQAKVVPSQKHVYISFPEIEDEVRSLSMVEGHGLDFVKGSKNPAWCVWEYCSTRKQLIRRKSNLYWINGRRS